MLFRPELARRSCQDCQTWLYDENTGKRLMRRDQPVLRPSTIPTPCAQCPKGSPEKEHETRLTRRNAAVVELYRMVRATSGSILTEEMKRDRRMLKDLALCDDLFRSLEQKESREHLQHDLTSAIGKAFRE